MVYIQDAASGHFQALFWRFVIFVCNNNIIVDRGNKGAKAYLRYVTLTMEYKVTEVRNGNYRIIQTTKSGLPRAIDQDKLDINAIT